MLEIKKYNNSCLRVKCKKVEQVTEQVEVFTEKMLKTMHLNDGIGLSAPQVGDNRRIIVIDINPIIGKKNKGLFSLINPEIIKTSEKYIKINEGCLSLPGVNLKIKRHKTIKVKAYSVKHKKEIIIQASGLLSAVLQHEIDHLDGVLIIDRVGFFAKRKALKRIDSNY
ncbi:peptide deformylase [Patescibacteria group bacterium]|nr:peptide deformylase [Patescibacteria group bacterium]